MITDIRPYKEHLDQLDLTEQEKLELVNAIWVIGKHFMDRAFGVHPWDKRKVGHKFQEVMEELNPKSPPRTRTKKRRKSS